MATLFASDGRLYLETNQSEKGAASLVGGRWDKSLRVWRMPLDVDIETLQMVISLTIEPSAELIFQQEWDRQRRFAPYHSMQYAPVCYPADLSDYQTVGVRFMADAQRCVLGDAVGLGKTAQAIRAVEELSGDRILVAAPKSVLLQWSREIDRFAIRKSVFQILGMHTPLSNARWIITNYEVVVRRGKELLKSGFDVLICDEAARLKNPKAVRTKAVRSISKKIPCCWLLTGTPIRNQPPDLWSLLHILEPERYSSLWRWAEKYCVIVNNGYGQEIRGWQSRRLAELQSELLPRMLRRDKSLLGLPPLTHEDVYVGLTPEQERYYREMEDLLVTQLDEGGIVAASNTLAQLTRLRQLTCSPVLLGGSDKSTKTEWLREYLFDHAQDHKILVFSTWAEYALFLFKELTDWDAACVVGSMSVKERAESVRRFQEDPNCRVLFASTDAAGEGLNMQAADVVIFMNKPWTPDQVEQAEGRAHRRGQTKPVHVISLIAEGTVDEYLEQVLALKGVMITEALAKKEVLQKLLEGRGVKSTVTV